MRSEGATIVIGDIDPATGKTVADDLNGTFVQVDVSDQVAVDALFDTEILDNIGGPLVGLCQQHSAGELVVDHLSAVLADEERDYMYSEYAKDPRMKANVGIRRRLAPLLENDFNQMRLFTALLLSLPGSPVLYYGDEIGMGDVIWLGDRDGVRTPMQWTPDRNAGFSTANPGRLYLPTNQDSVYGYQAVNVEAQRDTYTSLLNWTRTMLGVRRRHDAFAVGSFHELGGSNPSVLAYVREVPRKD